MEPTRPAGSLRADAALVGITALWGLTFVTVKDALAYADPFTFLALRFALGAVVAAAVAGRSLANPAAWRAGGVLGLLLFVGFVLQTFGLEDTTPARSAFITGLTVILVPFVSTALSRRLPPASAALGAGLAVLGLARLTGLSVDAAPGPISRGDLLTLAATVAYAFHIVLTERAASRAPATALVTVQLAVTAGLSAACVPLGEQRFEATLRLLGALVLTGVFASAMAISVQTWAQARTSAVRAALIFALEPVFAALTSHALARERIGEAELSGGALILAGIVASELGALRRRGWR